MTAPKKSVTPKTTKHLTTAQKAEIIAIWKAGGASNRALAKQFKCAASTITRILTDAGVTKGEEAAKVAEQVEEAVKAAIVTDAAIYAARIKATKEDHYKMADGISKFIWAAVVRAKQNNVPLGSIAGDLKSLHIAASGLKICREERYAVLGVNEMTAGEDRPLPDLVVQELSIEDIKEMHKSQMVRDEDGEFDLGDLGDESLLDEMEDKVETE